MVEQLKRELKGLFVFGDIERIDTIQSLWSGYGSILKLHLLDSQYSSVIVKRICPPQSISHPRNWNSDIGHQRKLKSYAVEANWYEQYAHRTNSACKVPQLIGKKEQDEVTLLVLEDLDGLGYPLRKENLDRSELQQCLSWLANFHACFMQENPVGLWEIGTYWQLDTRPEEWEAMPSDSLKSAAHKIHKVLNNCQHLTLVHGDAKYANFCFAKEGAVAAVDFQYVGSGCGMKDVAYLLSCIAGGISSQDTEEQLLNYYFECLQSAINELQPEIDFAELEKEWRRIYPIAFADFERFLQGWAPDHWKRSNYSKLQVKKALDCLKG